MLRSVSSFRLMGLSLVLALGGLFTESSFAAQQRGLNWTPQKSKVDHFLNHSADCVHSEEDLAKEVQEFESSRLLQMLYNANRISSLNSSQNPVETERDPYHFVSSIGIAPIPKVVTLTFDDGPHPALTPGVLDILARYNIKATFFVVGRRVAENKDIMERIQKEGHIVASHSFTHSNFHKLTSVNQLKEVDSTHEAISPYFGDKLKLFRYPYGNGSTVSRNHVRLSLKYAGVVGWHVDSCDWAFAKTGSVTPSQKLICGVKDSNVSNFAGHVLDTTIKKNGGILLFHDVHQRTLQQLDIMIEEMIRQKFKFANLDDPRMTQFFK